MKLFEKISAERRLALVRWAVAFGAIAGVLLSSRLWISTRNYPRAPLFDFLPALPYPLDLLLLVAMAAGLVVNAMKPGLRWVPRAWLVGYVCLAATDQSRLQPWAYQYALLVAIFAFADTPRTALNACRLLIVAVYFWSGIHKLNESFFRMTFPWLTEPIVHLLPPSLAELPRLFSPAVPVIEFALSLALLLPRTRTLAVLGLLSMHVFILGVLGPWAHYWNTVVWPWNLAMMCLVPVLFLGSTEVPREVLRNGRKPIQFALFGLVFFLPLLSLFGLWDLYLSFALYAGNPLYGDLRISPRVWERLDGEAQAFTRAQGNTYLLTLDEWSYTSLNTPAYPAERVLRALARHYCVAGDDDDDLRLELWRSAAWGFRPGWQKTIPRSELCL